MSVLSFHANKSNLESQRRWFAGVSLSANARRMEAAMIGVHGRGCGAPVEIRKTLSFDVPHEIVESYHELQEIVHERAGNSRFDLSEKTSEKRIGAKAETTIDSTNTNLKESMLPISLYEHVLRELACIEEEALEELLLESQLTKNDMIAAGIHDPGIYVRTQSGIFYRSLCNPVDLARRTGLNIIDSFPLHDIASHGNGGPIFALPTWIFLHSTNQNRILLDLGCTAKLTFLPQVTHSFSHERIQHQQIIPCGTILDALTWELTGGQTSIDTGGCLSVQGCQIPTLLNDFRQMTRQLSSQMTASQKEWSPFGLSAESYLAITTKASQGGCSWQDILCTTSYFIAESVVSAVQNVHEKYANNSEKHSDIHSEIYLCGAARMHGMLANLISSALPHFSMKPISQLDIPSDTFDALCTAMLTLLFVDHIPAGLSHLTGCETSRILGSVTPGSIVNWHRLLQEMSATKPVGHSLRAAI
ncbi:MAG: anhydro-N-acetylmuramic acid kinase [Thermoguttaceae bacterium]